MNNLKVAILVIIIFTIAVLGIYYVYQSQVKKSQDLLPYPTPDLAFNTTPSPTPQPQVALGIQDIPTIQPESGTNTQEVNNIGITINQPKASTVIKSPLQVAGTANVFEGKVIINILDANGKVLGNSQATACMSYDACPFDVVLEFKKPATSTGLLQAYNPSGVDGSPKYLQNIVVRF